MVEIAEKVLKLMNSDKKVIILKDGMNKEYTPNISRLLEEMGGYKFISLDEGIKIQIESDSLQKVQDTSIIQSVIAKDNITKLYDKNMSKICEMKDAKIEVKDNYIVIYNENEKKYFNKEGNEIKNTEVYPNNVLFAQQRDNKWGFVNKDGDMVVEAKYDKVTEFNEFGFASVQKDEKWGAINTQGKEVVEPTYNLKDEIEPSFIGTYYQVKYGFGEVYYTDAK